ncbi:MAG: transporter substrate-binding domain-containing protein [Notoacmeibacter sp.]|nr:transporter substrate-binding domain-containing protein [Notoacmeibacter sp.]
MKGLTRRLFSLAALSAACFAAAAPFSFARPLEEIEKTGRITIFVYADYPPWSWKKDGEMTGIDVDIAREIAKGLGFELDLLVRQGDENVDDDLRVNVWKGDIIEKKAADIMLHVPYDRALEIRSESLAILFNPYFGEEHAVIFDKARLPEVKTFGRFVTNKIGAELDSASDFFLSNAFRGQLLESIRRGRTLDDTFNLFLSGEVPALMGSRAQVEYVAHLATGKLDTSIVQPPMQGIVRAKWPIGMAVKENSRDVGYAVGDIITALQESGKLEEICERYGVTYLKPELE